MYVCAPVIQCFTAMSNMSCSAGYKLLLLLYYLLISFIKIDVKLLNHLFVIIFLRFVSSQLLITNDRLCFNKFACEIDIHVLQRATKNRIACQPCNVIRHYTH